MGTALTLLKSLTRIVFPEVCSVCGCSLMEGEQAICLSCLVKLPRTNIHTLSFNSIHERLAAPGILIERAGAWFYYLRGNPYVSLIHDAKYRGMPKVAHRCGRLYASEIAPSGFFDGIDALLPVPLHKEKERERGYNQAFEIARGVSAVTGIPIAHNLKSERRHSTQTRRSPWQRWINVRHTYSLCSPDELDGKHVLIIDDVITTGATLLSCSEAVFKSVSNPRVSILTLGATYLQ